MNRRLSEDIPMYISHQYFFIHMDDVFRKQKTQVGSGVQFSGIVYVDTLLFTDGKAINNTRRRIQVTECDVYTT